MRESNVRGSKCRLRQPDNKLLMLCPEEEERRGAEVFSTTGPRSDPCYGAKKYAM